MYTRIRSPFGPGWSSAVLRDADAAVVPPDPDSRDWAAYKIWLAAGNAPREPAAQAAPPRAIEGRLLVKALTDDQAARVKLRDLLRIAGDRDIPETNGAVIRVAGHLGLAIPDWFDAAAAS